MDSLAQLKDDARRVIATAWLGRAQGERTAAETFRVVAEGLTALNAERELLELARRAVDDELNHAERCWKLACRYAGRELPVTPPTALSLPRYEGASETLRHTLHVVGQCCLNETTASAFLERCLQLATDGEARATLRALLSDEVDHARLGWAHLASPLITIETRRQVADWLPQMITTNLRAWRARPDVPTDSLHAAHGLLPWAMVDEAVTAAIDDLIIPGLRHVGIEMGAK